MESPSRAQKGCVSAILGLCTKGRGMGQGQLGSVLRTASVTGREVTGSLWDPRQRFLCWWSVVIGCHCQCFERQPRALGGGRRQHRARQQEEADWILVPGHSRRAGVRTELSWVMLDGD